MVVKKTEQSNEMMICIKSKEKSEEFLKKVILDNYLFLVDIYKYNVYIYLFTYQSIYKYVYYYICILSSSSPHGPHS